MPCRNFNWPVRPVSSFARSGFLGPVRARSMLKARYPFPFRRFGCLLDLHYPSGEFSLPVWIAAFNPASHRKARFAKRPISFRSPGRPLVRRPPRIIVPDSLCFAQLYCSVNLLEPWLSCPEDHVQSNNFWEVEPVFHWIFPLIFQAPASQGRCKPSGKDGA